MESSNEMFADTVANFGLDIYDATFEYVDNSVSSKAPEIDVEFYVEPAGKKKLIRVAVTDNGSGIPLDKVADALSVGLNKQKQGHEHDVGMKIAFSYFGDNSIKKGLHKVDSYDGTNAYEVLGYEGNTLLIKDKPTPTGNPYCTVIANVEIEHYMSGIISTMVERLGARYRRFIEKGGKLSASLIDITTNKHIVEYEVDAKNCPYFDKDKEDTPSESQPLWSKEIVLPCGIEATLTIGLMREDNTTGPWKKLKGKGGVDVIQHDIAVSMRDFSMFPVQVHDTHNRMIGTLEVTKGHFPTLPRKSGLDATSIEFSELQSFIEPLWPVISKRLGFGSTKDPSKFDEKDLHQAIQNHLNKQSVPGHGKVWSDVKLATSTDTGLETDVTGKETLSDSEYVFEAKVDSFTPQDVNQLVGYLIAKGIDNGVAVCLGKASDNAKKQLDYWKAKIPTLNVEFWDSKHSTHTSIKAELESIIKAKK